MDQQDPGIHDKFIGGASLSSHHPTQRMDYVSFLVQQGLTDLTPSINSNTHTGFPVLAGGFSDVYRGTLRDGTRVAIKVYRTYEVSGREKRPREELLKRMAKELYILSKLQHPNLIPLMGMAQFRNQLSMVTKWIENGSLRRYISQNPKANRFQLGMDVCAGLCYLHDSGVIHGDIRAGNILVSSEGVPMIADFENAGLSDPGLELRALKISDSRPGFSLRWAAPELLKGASITRATDIYAYGMTLLEVVTGQPPFAGMNEQVVSVAVMINRRVPERPSVRLGDASWALLLSCWGHSPDDRPTIRDVQARLQAILHDWESSPDKRGSNPWDFLDPSEQVEAPTRPPDNERDHIIGTDTPMEDIMAMLVKNGCTDLTDAVDHSLCGQNPYTAGGFGDIYRGALKSGTTVAIKVLLLRTDSVEIDVQGKVQKRTARELYHWARLRHPNVLPLTGFALFRGQVSMVSEWMQGGSIVSYLESNPNANRIQLCVDVCAGLSYIHEEDMVHGDLKAANVMVSATGAAMIGDFGNADLEELRGNFTRTAQRPGVSIRWASPELLFQNNTTPNKGSDVYACGMTILETVTGDLPFKDRSIIEVMLMHQAGELHPRPSGMIDSLWDLLMTCWDPDVNKRATIGTVMNQLGPLVADAHAIYRAVLEDQNKISEGPNKALGTKSKQTDAGITEESDYITRPPGATVSYYEHHSRSLPDSGILSYAKVPPSPEYVTARDTNTVYYTAPSEHGSPVWDAANGRRDAEHKDCGWFNQLV